MNEYAEGDSERSRKGAHVKDLRTMVYIHKDLGRHICRVSNKSQGETKVSF